MPEDVYQTAKVAKVLMLLNEGKGQEFKGKSLSEIELSEDFLEFEKDEEENENGKNLDEINRLKTRNEIKETKEIKPEICFEKTNAILECYSDCDPQEMKEDAEDDVLPKNKRRVTEEVTANKNIKLKRHIWSEHEKQLVLTYFKKHIRSKKAPKKNECLELISKHPNFFKCDDWVRIKTLVYNTYRQK